MSYDRRSRDHYAKPTWVTEGRGISFGLGSPTGDAGIVMGIRRLGWSSHQRWSRMRHLPVIDHEALVGLISIGDLVKARLMDQESEVDSLKSYVAGVG